MNLVQQLMDMNRRRSKEFSETIHCRREYRDKHPTQVSASECMDGRVDVTAYCEVPFGLINIDSNIGGHHELGWPGLGESIAERERYAHRKRLSSLYMVTYHYSASDEHLGCAGFKYDTQAAISDMNRFKSEIDSAFSERIYTVLVGMETDSESLILHSENGLPGSPDVLDMRAWVADAGELGVMEKVGEGLLKEILGLMLPKIPQSVRNDLVPLLLGNALHVLKVKRQGRSLNDLKHNESVLAIGTGLDWVLNNNLALVIGPHDSDLDRSIITAAGIIKKNRDEGRVMGNGALLVSTAGRYSENKRLYIKRSCYLARLALEYIQKEMPTMADFFVPLVGVTHLDTRRFEPIEF